MGKTSFNDEYILVLEWYYGHNTNKFILNETYGNKSPDDNPIFDKKLHTISSVKDLQNICIQLNNLGYKITKLELGQDCSFKYDWTVCFRHLIDLVCLENAKILLVKSEHIIFHDEYTLDYDYVNNTSSIFVLDGSRRQGYYFDYILNIDLKKYNSVKNKIQQTLLLG